MRSARRVVSFAAILCLLATSSAISARADGDTWSGTWARTEVGGNLILTQQGNVVSGPYTWNDGSGHVQGTTSGSSFSGSFDENHYKGSFELTLSGKSFTGSYSGINKDTDGDISGSFSGTCIAGACLSNGAPSGSAEPSSSPSPAAPTLSPSDAEQALKAALAGADIETLLIELHSRAANSDEAASQGKYFANVFREHYPDASPATVDFIQGIAEIAGADGSDGTPVSPAAHALLPIVIRMAANGVNAGDPAAEANAVLAARRLTSLAVGSDLGFQHLQFVPSPSPP